MKMFLNFMIFFMTTLASAQSAVLVAAPGLSETIYQDILAERKDLLSPAQSALISYQQQEARPEIFAMSDQCLLKKNCQNFSKNFEKFREQGLINPTERQLLLELWVKSGRAMDCYWQNSKNCQYKKLSLEKLGLGQDQNFVVFIDGTVYKPGDDINLLPQRKYQWKIISSRFQSKSAWATIEEIQSQVSLNSPFVTGGCLASSAAQGVEKVASENMYVAFDRTCVRKLAENSTIAPVLKNESWIERNKVWLISALVVTAGASYYLKDQQIEFSSPFK